MERRIIEQQRDYNNRREQGTRYFKIVIISYWFCTHSYIYIYCITWKTNQLTRITSGVL